MSDDPNARFDKLLKAMAPPSGRKRPSSGPASGENRPHVPAILKLPQILRKMLPADMNVSAIDPALQLRPEALQGVDPAPGFGGVLAAIVVHFEVAIAGLAGK